MKYIIPYCLSKLCVNHDSSYVTVTTLAWPRAPVLMSSNEDLCRLLIMLRGISVHVCVPVRVGLLGEL